MKSMPPFSRRPEPLLLGAALLAAPLPLAAQEPAPDTLPTTSAHVGGLVLPGSVHDDRRRVAQLLGRAGTAGTLIRSTSTLIPSLGGQRGVVKWALVAPEVRTAWNSDIPFSANDGTLWAGRGMSGQVTAGLRAEIGPVSLVLAPQVTYTENRAFGLLPGGRPDSSLYRASWRVGLYSADLPFRFGREPYTQFDLGQSTLSLRAGPVVAGASSEDQWWGPGRRNAIVLSNNAPGIPHAFVRTHAPVRTRVGDFEARWIAGALTESLYFDDDPGNDLRSISAVAATFRPRVSRGLTVGISRSVVAAVDGPQGLGAHVLDVFTDWTRREIPTDSTGALIVPRTRGEGSEQILSVFGRWVSPADRLELYGEWARHRLAEDLGDFLALPNHTQGYTLGLQWLSPPAGPAERLFRLATELTYLEQSSTMSVRPGPGYYTSPFVVQGYTQRGQNIGAATGPGSSSQWLALDYLWKGGALGVSFTRIRWDNSAFYVQPTGTRFSAHDVSVLAGLRGEWRSGWGDVGAEVARESRMNFLFQNRGVQIPGTEPPLFEDVSVDARNLILRLTFSPRP